VRRAGVRVVSFWRGQIGRDDVTAQDGHRQTAAVWGRRTTAAAQTDGLSVSTLHSPDQSLHSPVCTPHYTHLTNHSLLDRRTPHVQHTMAKRAMQSVARVKQEAQLMLTNPRDAFRGQLRSPNTVPFHMLGILSSCAIVTLSFLSLSFVFLLTFFWYSNSQNVVTLRSGSEVTQGHWKWYNILHMVSY